MSEKYIKYIKQNLNRRDLFEQLAEEASELSKASLKCIRAFGLSNNYTPVEQPEAVDNLIEELNDILMVMIILFPLDYKVSVVNIFKNKKWKRWAERLGYREK